MVFLPFPKLAWPHQLPAEPGTPLLPASQPGGRAVLAAPLAFANPSSSCHSLSLSTSGSEVPPRRRIFGKRYIYQCQQQWISQNRGGQVGERALSSLAAIRARAVTAFCSFSPSQLKCCSHRKLPDRRKCDSREDVFPTAFSSLAGEWGERLLLRAGSWTVTRALVGEMRTIQRRRCFCGQGLSHAVLQPPMIPHLGHIPRCKRPAPRYLSSQADHSRLPPRMRQLLLDCPIPLDTFFLDLDSLCA